jgi:6-phosphofructokinase 2
MQLDVVTVTLNPAVDVTAEVDALVPYRKLRAELVAHDPGGGGINVARVLHRLGVAVRAVFPAGGLSGAELVSALAREGVPMEAVESAAPTRESITIWVRSSGEHYRILVAGEPLEERAWRGCTAAVRAAPRWVVLSGSLPPAVPASVVLEIAAVAREHGAGFACDSSGEALAAAVEAGADLISPNRRELRELVDPRASPTEFDHEAAARELVARGVRAVVVSLGADGGFATSAAGTETRRSSPSVQVLSAVGAGDSLLAGVVAGLLRGESLDEALRRGVATGAATCLEHGSELARPEAVEELLARREAEDRQGGRPHET